MRTRPRRRNLRYRIQAALIALAVGGLVTGMEILVQWILHVR